MRLKRIIILGGYGNFGKRIAENLARLDNFEIMIAGRSLSKAKMLCEKLSNLNPDKLFTPVAVDINASNFAATLLTFSPFLVIHTSGPFQGQGYQVPEACLAAGAHYIDLADDRRFVCDIQRYNEQAKAKNLLLVTGASSVPGLSSTVIDTYRAEFSSINSIDIAIAPGNKAERGEATIKGILSYTGHPFKAFYQSKWQNVFGWMSPTKSDFGDEIGQRWLANVDVPDLELFPSNYSVSQRVSFQAGLELGFLHFTMVAMAWLTKIGLVKNWSPLTKPIVKLSEYFLPFGTDIGAMKVIINGEDHQQKNLSLTWRLIAKNGIGPFIPTFSACILAKQLLDGTTITPGAKPCLGLYSLSTFDDFIQPYDIHHTTERKSG